jgi:hypothetical protein
VGTVSGKRFMANVRSERKEASNAAAGVCKKSKRHGKAAKGGLCQTCWDKKLANAKKVRAQARAYRAQLAAQEKGTT